MVTGRTVDILDSTVVILSAFLAFLSINITLYVIPWFRCTNKNSIALKEYSSLWGVRVCLQLTATFFLLLPALQLHHIWVGYLNITKNIKHENLCNIFLAARLGCFEPFFMLLSLFTLTQFLRAAEGWQSVPTTNQCAKLTPLPSNYYIIKLSVLCTIPILTVQILIIVLSDKVLKKGSVPDFLFSTNKISNSCSDSHILDGKCMVCLYPLLSTIACALLILYYLLRIWNITFKMAKIALNRSIEQRMLKFRSAVTVLLLASIFCRSLIAVVNVNNICFQLLKVGDTISMLLFISAFCIMLILRPIREAHAADKVIYS